MGCLDSTPQGCKAWYDRSVGQPSCPALCPLDTHDADDDVEEGPDILEGSDPFTAIPLYDSTAPHCSGHVSCDADIVQQPFNPFQLTEQYTSRALSIIRSHAANNASSDPFFLYMAYSHMHSPMAYAARFSNSSTRSGAQRIFGNTLAELDDSVGRILQALDATGLRENTLVFLTSDNGPADLGKVSCDDIGSTGPFTGLWQRRAAGGGGGGGGGSTSKATVWEGGHHVVGIISQPGRIPAGTVSAELVSTVDILPTMAAVAGVSLPADRVYDGLDLSPILFGGNPAGGTATKDRSLYTARRVLFHPSGRGGQGPVRDVPAMRMGRYKAFFGE